MTTTTPTRTGADGFTRHRDQTRAAIIAQHIGPGGSLDVGSLVAAAIGARRAAQYAETRVNFGDDVTPDERHELTMLQARDIAHRDTLSRVVPGWDDGIRWARRRYPREDRATVMAHAARRMGVTR